MAYAMDRADFVLIGSEAVVESGGLIHGIGSNQMAIIAKAANKPLYALAERSVWPPQELYRSFLTAWQLQVSPTVPTFSGGFADTPARHPLLLAAGAQADVFYYGPTIGVHLSERASAHANQRTQAIAAELRHIARDDG
jgi:hypothetical protein